MVTSPTNKGVILIGGYTNGKRSPFLYELSGDSEENLTWSMLDQKLSTTREYHVSFPIPNNCIPYLTYREDTRDVAAATPKFDNLLYKLGSEFFSKNSY